MPFPRLDGSGRPACHQNPTSKHSTSAMYLIASRANPTVIVITKSHGHLCMRGAGICKTCKFDGTSIYGISRQRIRARSRAGRSAGQDRLARKRASTGEKSGARHVLKFQLSRPDSATQISCSSPGFKKIGARRPIQWSSMRLSGELPVICIAVATYDFLALPGGTVCSHVRVINSGSSGLFLALSTIAAMTGILSGPGV